MATALLALAGCSSIATVFRPDGDGGWNENRRADEVRDAARVSGVWAAPASAPGGADGRTGSWAAASPRPARMLGLDEALALVVSGNRRLGEAREQLEAAAGRVGETRARLLPQALGTARYTRYSDSQTTKVVLPAGLLPAGTTAPDVVVRDLQAGVFNGTLTLPLDLSGELLQSLRAAQAGYRGEAARVWATTLEQQLAAVRAYFDLLQAKRLRGVTEQTIGTDRAQLAVAEARYKEGRLTKNDLLVVQVALRNAEQRLRQDDLAIERARLALNRTVGLEVDAPTEPVDVTTRPDIPGVEETLAAAQGSNPAIRALLEERQKLEATERSLEASRLPRFAAGGAIDYSTSDILQPQRIESGFAGLSWDLGTDGGREARISQARADVRRNRLALEGELREIEAAVRTTTLAALERLAALDTATVAVGQAEENLRIRQQQFDAGRAQSDDVLLAEQRVAFERATLSTALYEAHVRAAELRRLIGQPLEATGR